MTLELSFDREKNREQRLQFIHEYAAWVKSVPNEVWSRQQAVLIDSFMENSRNFSMPVELYLALTDRNYRQKRKRS